MGHKGKMVNGCFVDYYVSDKELDREFEEFTHKRYLRDIKKWEKQPNLYEFLKNNPLVNIDSQKEKLKCVKPPYPVEYATDEELDALMMAKAW